MSIIQLNIMSLIKTISHQLHIYKYFNIYIYTLLLSLHITCAHVWCITATQDFVCKVPMISSGDSNGDGADAAGLWLFRKQNNIQDAMVLMQQMDGKILAPKPKAKAKVKAKAKQESKGKGRGGGRGKAKAAPKEKARGKDGEDIMDEPEKTADYVSCQVDGVAVLRTKYFLDCLVSAIRSALINARKQFGVPLGSQPVEPEALLGPPSAHGEALVYHDHEVHTHIHKSHTHIHTYTHSHIHTYTPTHIHTSIHA